MRAGVACTTCVLLIGACKHGAMKTADERTRGIRVPGQGGQLQLKIALACDGALLKLMTPMLILLTCQTRSDGVRNWTLQRKL